MNKEFIPCEEALVLKELGFNESCIAFWTNTPKYKGDNIQLCVTDGNHGYSPNSISFKQDFLREGEVLAPLYQQVFRWFRDNYGLSSSFTLKMKNGKRVSFFIIYELDNRLIKSKFFNSYTTGKIYGSPEETELECLKKLIEIIKNDKV